MLRVFNSTSVDSVGDQFVSPDSSFPRWHATNISTAEHSHLQIKSELWHLWQLLLIRYSTVLGTG